MCVGGREKLLGLREQYLTSGHTFTMFIDNPEPQPEFDCGTDNCITQGCKAVPFLFERGCRQEGCHAGSYKDLLLLLNGFATVRDKNGNEKTREDYK